MYIYIYTWRPQLGYEFQRWRWRRIVTTASQWHAAPLTTHCDDTLPDALPLHWRHITSWGRIVTTHCLTTHCPLTTHYPLTTHCDHTLPYDAVPADDITPDDALWQRIAPRRHLGDANMGRPLTEWYSPAFISSRHLQPLAWNILGWPLAATCLEFSGAATCGRTAASGCALPEMHGRLEISKNLASQEKRFFKVWKLDKSDLWYLMLAQDSQDHVAKRIPPMSQIAFFAHVWRDECVTTFINVNYTSNSAFQFPLSKARPQPRKTQYAFRKRLRMRPRRPKKREESPLSKPQLGSPL